MGIRFLNRFRDRRRHFESLEPRLTLAGNVTASLVGADLLITGDAQANVISVVETENDGQFVILAESDSSGVPTTLNGTPNGSAKISSVTGNIVINLVAGHDVVTVANLSHAGDLTIDGGAGDDSVSLANVSLAGTITVHTGTDQNVVTLFGLELTGDLIVDAGAYILGPGENDFLRQLPNKYLLTESVIDRSASFKLGARAGSVTVTASTVGGNLSVANSEQLSAIQNWAYKPLQASYAAMQFEDVVVGGAMWLDSSANTLVRTDNLFTGLGLHAQSYTSYNAFEILNSRFVGGLSVSTLAPPPYIRGSGGASLSAYDSLFISGVIVDAGLSTRTSGDVDMQYSYVGKDASVGTFRDNTLVFNTNIFNGDLRLPITGGNDVLEFTNSVVRGTAWIFFYQLSVYATGYSGGSSVFSFTNSRLGALDVRTNGDADELRVTGSILDQLFAYHGAGSARYELTGSAFNRGARLDGGDGFDLFRSSDNTFNGLELLNFEAF
jgi:hypothetical protein